MSTKLETAKQFGEHADQVVDYMVGLKKLKADQAQEIDRVKERYSTRIDPMSKILKSLKTRLTNYAKNTIKSTRIFDGKETGTFLTNRAKITVRKNPASIKLKDAKSDIDHLISEAKRMGFGNVLKTQEVFSLEAMEKLTDSELECLGWKRVAENKTFTIEPTADSTIKEKQLIESAVA